MTAHDAVEMQRGRIERDQAEIAGGADDRAANRIGQHAPDVKRFGDQDHDHRRQQRKTGDEDEAETEHDIDRALIDHPGAEIAELLIEHRDDHDHPGHKTGEEEAEEDNKEAADQRHLDPPSLRGALTTKQSILSLRRKMDCFASLEMTKREKARIARQSVIAIARSAWRSRADNFSVSDFNWPHAARMSRPRGVRTGEEQAALKSFSENFSICSQSEHSYFVPGQGLNGMRLILAGMPLSIFTSNFASSMESLTALSITYSKVMRRAFDEPG